MEAHLGIRSLDGLDGAEVLLQASDQLLLLNSLGCRLSEVDLQLRTAPCGERKMRPSEKSRDTGILGSLQTNPSLKARMPQGSAPQPGALGYSEVRGDEVHWARQGAVPT